MTPGKPQFHVKNTIQIPRDASTRPLKTRMLNAEWSMQVSVQANKLVYKPTNFVIIGQWAQDYAFCFVRFRRS